MGRFSDKAEWVLETLDVLIAQEERRVFDEVGDENTTALLYALRKDDTIVKLTNIKIKVMVHEAKNEGA